MTPATSIRPSEPMRLMAADLARLWGLAPETHFTDVLLRCLTDRWVFIFGPNATPGTFTFDTPEE